MKQPLVLFEDNHLLILNKPAGWLVQGDKTGDKTLTDWGRKYIGEKYNKPGAVFLHPTHRLDRPVSGITVFARTSKALERMNKLFRKDKIEKTYLAIVRGRPQNPAGQLVHWLDKDRIKNVVKAFREERDDAKKAELDYSLISAGADHSLLLVMPKTGRPHQIRVQLSSMSCPIVGDLKYGFPEPNPDKSISLHAFKVSFVHPVRKESLTIKSLPDWTNYKAKIHELD